MFLFHVGGLNICSPELHSVNYPETNGEIQNTSSQIFLVIEGNGFSQNFSEFHRFSAVNILNNQVIPQQFNFGNDRYSPYQFTLVSTVPIYIRELALLI